MNTSIQIKESTRKRPVSKRQRALLPNSGKPWINTGCSDVVKAELLKYFPELELIENPITRKVSVYRVLSRKNIQPSGEDILMHEVTLKAPVGSWLVQHLLMHDNFRKYGRGDDLLNGYLKEEKEAAIAKEKEDDRKLKEMSRGFAEGMAFAARGRESVVIDYTVKGF